MRYPHNMAALGTASPLERLVKESPHQGEGGQTAISSRTPSASMSVPLPALMTSPRDITQ